MVRQAIQIGACHYVNIKPGRAGGFTNSVAMHDICRDSGIPVWIGGMLESSVGAALCVELATLPNFTYPGDLFPSSKFISTGFGGARLGARAADTDLRAPPPRASPNPTRSVSEAHVPPRWTRHAAVMVTHSGTR